jgi:GntR family transcriptional regulator
MAGPLYRQIADQLRRMIESGELKAGTQIPTEDQLMSQFHTSRNTVRGALRELTTRDLVYTLHGKGTFVSKRPAPIVITLTSDPETGREGLVYTAEVAASGRKPELRALVVGFRRAGPAIARCLEIPEESEVIFRQEDGYVDQGFVKVGVTVCD